MLKNILYNSSEKMSQTVAAMTTTTKNGRQESMGISCLHGKNTQLRHKKLIIFIQFYRFYNQFNLLDLNDIICRQFQ